MPEGMPMVPMTPDQFAEFLAAHQKRHDEAETRSLGAALEKDDLLRVLTPPQLTILIKIIRSAAEDSNVAAFMVGEITSMLKFVHKVDPQTGLDPYARLLGADPHDIND